jgi:hypothetical protein
MTESQEKPLATWLMENIVKGDGSEYLYFEEIARGKYRAIFS